MKAQLDAQLEQQRIEFDRWKAELEAATRLQIAQIGAQQAISIADMSAQQAAASDLQQSFSNES